MSRRPGLSVLVLTVLVAVVAVGGAGGVSPADDPATLDGGVGEIDSVDNTTNYLYPDEDFSRQTYVRTDVDVAGAVGISTDRLQGRYSRLRFDRRFSAAGNAAAKLVVIDAEIAAAETRLSRLNTSQRALFDSYASGSLSTDRFVRRLSRIQVRATQATTLLDRVRTQANISPDVGLTDDRANLITIQQVRLVALPGPVTTSMVDTIAGNADSETVYVAGTDDALVLAAAGEDYTRQATLQSAYAPGAADQFVQSSGEPVSLALDRTRELYPWVFDNLQNINGITPFPSAGVYIFDLSHAHGDLRTYIGGGSTDVFREHHSQRLDAPPVTLTERTENASLGLRVNATAPTGPMHVSVVEADTGAPVAATVSVRGARVGATGDDGELWAIRPAGELRVTATTEDGRRVVLTRP